MSFKFIPNPSGIDRIAKGPGVTGFVNKNAQRVLQNAKAAGNTDDEYRASLSMDPAVVGSDEPAKVKSDSPFWHLFEFGSTNNPPYRPLSNAVRDAGLDFEPS